MGDKSDVSLEIRRAKRSRATCLDLGKRGLRAWAPELFELRSLEVLDVSGNELTSVDPGITQLKSLEVLDISHNRLDSLPEIDPVALPKLRSLVIDGNPSTRGLTSEVLRQLSEPAVFDGHTAVAVISDLLCRLRQTQPDAGSTPLCSVVKIATDLGSEALDDPCGVGDTDDAALRLEVNPFGRHMPKAQSEQQFPGVPVGPTTAEADRLPAWLQDSGNRHPGGMLPSRRLADSSGDELSTLRDELVQEKRRSKRLEQDVQKLTMRAEEKSLVVSRAGSIPQIEMNDVKLGRVINQGGFSVVHEGTWQGARVAVKKLFDPNITADLLAEFDNEVRKLEQIRHPNILLLLAVHRQPPALAAVTELCEGGSLHQLLHERQAFVLSTRRVSSIDAAADLWPILDTSAAAIAFLHARGLVHRDVKAHNVLLSPSLEVKLCDFGLAQMRSELMTGAMQFAGTPAYMAPEVFRQQRYTETVDVFAFGTLLWEALTEDQPWIGFEAAEIRDRVLSGDLLPIPASVPSAFQSVVQACWTLDRQNRPAMADILDQFRRARGLCSRRRIDRDNPS